MEFRAQISIFGFHYNRQLPSDQVIIRWLSKWSTLDKWMCAIFSLVFACSCHLFRNKYSNVCSVYSVISRNTSIRIDIGFILSHLCVKLNFMHSLSYDTNDAHHWKSFVKWFYIYCSHTEACTPRMCLYVLFFPFVALSFNISSNGSPFWCGRFRFCATFWFEAIWFCVLCTHHFHKTNIA